jgi:hypothetical protein
MISTPPSLLRWTAVLLAAGSAVFAFAAGELVSAPAKRHEAIEAAKKLLAPKEAGGAIADPFHSQAFAEFVAGTGRAPAASGAPAAPGNPVTDRDLVQAIAASLKPSGFFVIGGEPTLVFGQKRVKAGGVLTITFEGNEYTLEVTKIDRTNFTLRLNREEFTRPIK